MTEQPVVLELAPLAREQVGPFLLLGVPKTAAKEEIEANWARRLIWARKSQIRTPLEDVNWAREILGDADKRVRADVASLNLDTTDGVLRRLAERREGKQPSAARFQPLDVEKSLADYTPPAEVPDRNEVKAGITVPDVPEEFPAVARLLDEYLKEPLDPWQLPKLS